ncbi:MAG TPA: hypothetical protein VGP35_04320 [Terriglobales bacterium]|jgi:hypothetical protein|nr:hypothetical protein [Terriglobales bacterium]
MKRYLKLAAFCAAFVLSATMFAAAGSTDNFSGPLVGASGTESGQFTFDSKTDTFSGIKLSFAGSTFGNVNAANAGGKATWCSNGACGFVWQTTVSGDTIWDLIIVNLSTGQYTDAGIISNSQNKGGFNYMSVPEGSSGFAYLFMSAIAVFGTIFVSGRRRRAVPTA